MMFGIHFSSICLFILSLLSLSTGCVKRSGELFKATYPWTGDNYILAAMETASGNGKLVCFSVNLNSSLLTEVSQIDTEISPRFIEIGSGLTNTETIYVANYTSGSISVYSFNQTTASMALIQTISGLNQVTSLVFNPYLITFYAGYASGIQKYSVASDGTLTVSGNLVTVGGAVQGMSLSPNGEALYANSAGTAVYTVAIDSSGNLSVGTNLNFTSIISMSSSNNYSNGNSYLFVADVGANNIKTYLIDSSTEALTLKDTTSVAGIKTILYYPAASAPSLLVHTSTGTLYSYGQGSNDTLTLNQTNNEVSDTMISSMSISNVNLKLFTVGVAGGIYSWEYGSSLATVLSNKLRRNTSLANYGTQANAIKGFIVQ